MTAIELPKTVPPMSKVLAGVRILVVDDELDALTLMEDFLHGAGATTRLARSADEALRLLDERIDVIVSDISMPDGDGYQLMRRIRARAPEHGGTTPAVALTAHVEDVDHARALLAGFQMHLCKPIKAMELVASIHQLLARRTASH
jgi:CheY-like chemotaxis protein